VAGLIAPNPLEPNAEVGLSSFCGGGDKAAWPNIDPEPNAGLSLVSDGPPRDIIPKDGTSSDAMESSAGAGGAGGGEEAGCVGGGDVPNPNALWPNLADPAEEKAPKPPVVMFDPNEGEEAGWPNGEVDTA
jgi:hypothetical protein